HRVRDLSRVGAFVLPEHVLGAEADLHPVGLDHRLGGAQRRERRRHHDFDPLVDVGFEAVVELLDHLDGLQMIRVHLPVPANQLPPLAHETHLSNTATPGSSLPSNSSNPAPPPVDRCEIWSSMPSRRTAAAESPPPTAVNPLHSAIARATASVPARKFSHSNTPIGPFQNTDWATRITDTNASAVAGPMSRPMVPSGISSAAMTRWSASSVNESATTTSDGNWIRSPCGPSSRSRTESTWSSSTRLARTSYPRAASSVKHMPPPTSIESTLGSRFSITPSLSDTLAPPRTTTQARSGAPRNRPRDSSSETRRRPAAERTRSATPTVEACARCTEPKASWTNTSAKPASLSASSGSFFVSPVSKRVFSRRSTSPGLAWDTACSTSPPTTAPTGSTSKPATSLIRAATGAIE